MTVSENLDNKHYDVYLERQLQLSLLKADDEFARRDHFEVTRKSRSNFWKRKGRKDEDGDLFELTGWAPENNTALRKTEKSGTGSDRSSNREYISWRDGKIRRMDRHYFNFRHYKDTKKYIEQYRRECTCAKNTGVSSKECLELKPYQCYEKCNAAPNSKKVSRKREPSISSNKPHIFSYTNRANPVGVHTDFYNGNNLAHVMENNVSQILRTDSENLAQEKDIFGRRIHTPSRGSATPGRDRNSINESDHKVPNLNGSHRIPSATKLPPPTKIRTLDVLRNSPDSAHQLDDLSDSEYSDSDVSVVHRRPIATPVREESSGCFSNIEAAVLEQEDSTLISQSEPICNTFEEQLSIDVDEQIEMSIKSAPVSRIEDKLLNGTRSKTLDTPSLLSLKEPRYLEQYPTFVAFTTEVTPSIVGQGKQVWNPGRSAPVDKDREKQRGREAGMNCPFKTRDVSNPVYVNKVKLKRSYHIKGNIDPPGKMGAVLIKTGSEDSEFPQPMCYNIKTSSVKNNGAFSGGASYLAGVSSTPKAKQSASNEEVLRMRKILSSKVGTGPHDRCSAFDNLNSPKEKPRKYPNRTESSYRQKLYLPSEELVPSRHKPDSRVVNMETVLIMPDIMNTDGQSSPCIDTKSNSKYLEPQNITKEHLPKIEKKQHSNNKPPVKKQQMKLQPTDTPLQNPPPDSIGNVENLASKTISPCLSPWISEDEGNKYIRPANKFANKTVPSKLQGQKDRWTTSTPTEQKLRQLVDSVTSDGKPEGDQSPTTTKKLLEEMKPAGPAITSGINKTKSANDVITTSRTACSSSSLRTTMQQHRASMCHSSTVRDGSDKSKYINMTHHHSKKSPTNASDNSSYETVDPNSSSNTEQRKRRPSKSKIKKQLPSQETPTDAGQTQDSGDMSWREKLHALRQVNKPHNKEKDRRLLFYKEDYELENYDIVCNPCVSHRRNIQKMIGHSKLNGIYEQIGSTLTKPRDTLISSFLIKKCDVISCSQTKTDEIIDAVRDCQEHNYALRPMLRYNKANT